MAKTGKTLSVDGALSQSIDWARAHEAELLGRYQHLLRMPTISNDPSRAQSLLHCAAWLHDELLRIGLDHCQLLESDGPPMVYGEWLGAGDERPVVLIYAHYDVMPVDPLDQWASPPFEPTIRDGRLYARGAIDDKCGVSITLAALEAMFLTIGGLPINVKLLFDGEEEQGSPHIAGVVDAYRDLLRADLLVVSDGGGAPGKPLIMTGVRGTVDAEVKVHGPRTDLHSGLYGGVVHNPIHLVGKIIAALHDHNGRVRIPDFYAGIRPLTEAEQTIIAATEPGMLVRARQDTGRQMFWGEALGPYGVRATALPACDVNGVWGGYQGPGNKTVIPAQAGFKVSMRIVPDQDPHQILNSFAAFVAGFACDTLAIEVVAGATNWPATLLQGGPVIERLQQAYVAVWGMAAQLYRAGGSVPLIGYAQRLLGMPILDLGFGVGDNVHAPNEYLELDYFRKGLETALHFYYGIAAIPRAEMHPATAYTV